MGRAGAEGGRGGVSFSFGASRVVSTQLGY